MNADKSIEAGNLEDALCELQNAVRNNPARRDYRTFLFQLLCVMGDWNNARAELDLVATMDSSALPTAQTCRELLSCEAFRTEVFSGHRAPLRFGEPNDWLGTLMQSLEPVEKGNGTQANELVMAAMDQAVPRSGCIDDEPFSWFSDADMRLGPVFELILNGKYYWVPIDNIAEIAFSEPGDLRDLVWLPIQVRWVNDGNSIGFMPTRYPGIVALQDPQCALARKTDWTDSGEGFFTGTGQRMFTTENDEYSLLQTRRIVFDTDARQELGWQ